MAHLKLVSKCVWGHYSFTTLLFSTDDSTENSHPGYIFPSLLFGSIAQTDLEITI